MPKLRTSAKLALVAMALSLAGAIMVYRARPPEFYGTYIPSGMGPHDFTLTAARGPVSLSDFRGRVPVVFFGYTSCPDVCPMTMAKLDRALELLGDRRRDVQVILVSVDPDVDSPEDLRAYVQDFDLGFVGLTGERSEIEAVAAMFGAYPGEPPSAPGAEGDAHAGHEMGAAADTAAPAGHRLITHSSHVFGIDRAGRTRVLWGADATPEQIAQDLRGLLRL